MATTVDAPVLFVSLIFGSLSLGSAIWVWVKHRVFGLGGPILSVAGIILIGMSVWKTIDVDTSYLKLRLDRTEQDIKNAELKINDLNNFKTALVAQAQFKELNLYNGPIDGTYNANFKNAVMKFQASHGIQTTGIVDNNTLISLKDKENLSPGTRQGYAVDYKGAKQALDKAKVPDHKVGASGLR